MFGFSIAMPVLGLAFVMAVIHMIGKVPVERPSIDWRIGSIIAFLFWALISIAINRDQYRGNHEILIVVKQITGSMVIAFLSAQYLTERSCRLLVLGSLTIVFAGAMLGIIQFLTMEGYVGSILVQADEPIGKYFYATGFAELPLTLGLQLIMFILLAVPYMNKFSRTYRNFLLPAFAICGAALAMTLSRSVWLGFILGAGVWVILDKNRKKALILLAPTLVAFLIVLSLMITDVWRYGAYSRDGLSYNISERFKYDASAASRVALLKEGVRIIMDAPLFGVGRGNAPKHVDDSAVREYGPDDPHLHNTFLTIWAETGTVGFGIFAFMMAMGIWQYLRRIVSFRKDRDVAGLSAFLGVLAVAFFHGLSTDKYLWLVLGLALRRDET